jgi:hypothetical protein
MLYLVTGIFRTGTNMMMLALQAGGLVIPEDVNKSMILRKDYPEERHPNVGGFFELDTMKLYSKDFQTDYDEKLIKVVFSSLRYVPEMPNGMRIVFMTRNPDEMLASANEFFPGMELEMKLELERQDTKIEKLRARPDVKSLDVLKYQDVLKNPLEQFELLKQHGWPIDPVKCATIPNSKYNHFEETSHKDSINA